MIDKDYRNSPAISQSFLKGLEGFPKYLTLNEKKSTKALDMGSLIDTLLTDRGSFEKEYVVFAGNIPTEKIKLLADKYIELVLVDKEMGIETNHTNTVLQARMDVEYDARLSSPTVLEKFDKNCYEYTQFVLKYSDKIVISKSDFNYALELTDKCLEEHSYWLQDDKNHNVFFQQALYFNYILNTGDIISCKALPDVIHVDHIKKEISILDIKTYEDDFERNYYKYRYYYQAEYYLMAFRNRANFIPIPEGYALKNFYFLAIDKNKFKGNILYKYNPFNSSIVLNGGTLTDSRGNHHNIKGLRQLFKEFNYHSVTGNWEYPYEYLTQGFILI